MKTSVRRAGQEDARTLGRLLFDFNTEFGTPTPSAAEFAGRFSALLPARGTTALPTASLAAFIAEEVEDLEGADRRATGFALVSLRPTPYFDGPLMQLEELYVLPELRDRGLGTRLLEEVVSCARAAGSEEVHIGVDEVDTDTRRFYERHGFVNIEPGQDYRMLLYLRELGELGDLGEPGEH